MRVSAPVASLVDDVAPGRWQRQRELVLHERFLVLEETADWAFGQAGRDGYVGYIRRDLLVPDPGMMTHVVWQRQSYLAPVPDLKHARDEIEPVSFGTELAVVATHENGRWAEVARLRPQTARADHKHTWTLYVPTAHLRPIDRAEADPVAVAMRFLGVPYHWGGNSGFGIDCSGLVQAAHLACAIACPGDSDQQAARLGQPLPEGTPHARGDLVFWPGHVGIMVDPERVVHATAHHMAVVVEDLAAVMKRAEEPALFRRL